LREPLSALLPDLLVLGLLVAGLLVAGLLVDGLLVDGLDAEGFEAEGRDAPPAGCVLGRGAEAPARLPVPPPGDERSKPRAWSFVTRFCPAAPPNCCAVCGLL
jgi:hypothetical protein